MALGQMRAWISPPPDVKAQLAPVAPHLPAIVPLGYESTTAYVDRSTGIVVDQAVTEQVTPDPERRRRACAPCPVMATAMKATPARVQFAADKASSAGKLLMIVKTAAPIGLYRLGLALIIVAIVRRRKPASTQAAVPGAVEALVHA
jgi:hypothetical protein